MVKVGVFSDEVSQDLDTAIAFAKHYGLDGLELRSVWDRGPFEWTREDVARMREKLENAQLSACCLSLPFYKCEIDRMDERETHLNGLLRAIDYAHALECRMIRGFDFWRHGGETPVERIAEAYMPVVDMLKDTGITLAMEIEPSTYAASARELRAVLDAIGSGCIRALWDGGNLLWSESGEYPPDGYPILRDMIVHVHVKDGKRVDGKTEAVRIGTGESDVTAQFALLKADGYSGWVSLETHYRLSGAISDAQFRLPSGSAFSEGGYAASAESMESLLGVIRALDMA